MRRCLPKSDQGFQRPCWRPSRIQLPTQQFTESMTTGRLPATSQGNHFPHTMTREPRIQHFVLVQMFWYGNWFTLQIWKALISLALLKNWTTEGPTQTTNVLNHFKRIPTIYYLLMKMESRREWPLLTPYSYTWLTISPVELHGFSPLEIMMTQQRLWT